jgi:hypothetical protein
MPVPEPGLPQFLAGELGIEDTIALIHRWQHSTGLKKARTSRAICGRAAQRRKRIVTRTVTVEEIG